MGAYPGVGRERGETGSGGAQVLEEVRTVEGPQEDGSCSGWSLRLTVCGGTVEKCFTNVYFEAVKAALDRHPRECEREPDPGSGCRGTGQGQLLLGLRICYIGWPPTPNCSVNRRIRPPTAPGVRRESPQGRCSGD
jgi:hypothetical protein